MRKFHSIAALCGDGLRPELQALFDRLAIDPHSELLVRPDGTTQSGPDPVSKSADVIQVTPSECPDLKTPVRRVGKGALAPCPPFFNRTTSR
jgi:hypothetical protein